MRIEVKKLVKNCRGWVSHTVSSYFPENLFSSLVVTAMVMIVSLLKIVLKNYSDNKKYSRLNPGIVLRGNSNLEPENI